MGTGQTIRSIIIPFFNRWDLTHQILFDLQQALLPYKDQYEIILVNDASTDAEVYKGLAWWKSVKHLLPSVHYVRSEINKGFGHSMNLGCSAAHGDLFFLVSNDVRVRSAQPFITAEAEFIYYPKSIIGNQLVNFPGGWNEFEDADGKFFIPYVYGWFMAFTRDGWNELGGFDPIYAPFDYEDVDLSVKGLVAGYSLREMKSPFLSHQSGSTISSEVKHMNRLDQTKRNRQKFIEKWTVETLRKVSKLHEVK